MLELGFHQFTRIKTLAVDTPRPVARREEPHQVELTRLQRLQPGGVVFVDLDRDAIKVAEKMPDVETCLEASVIPGGVVT